MIFKKKEIFLLIFLTLLQSCSGGRIGNFLDSSFNDLEKISQNENLQEKLTNKKKELKESKESFPKNTEKTKKIEVKEIKGFYSENPQKIKKAEAPKNVLGNKKDKNLLRLQEQKNNKIKNSLKKRKNELQSYRIIFILKDVDPKDPTVDLSNILRNSEVNFEIEKIERILDKENKSRIKD